MLHCLHLCTHTLQTGWIVQEPLEGGSSVLAVEGEAPAHYLVHVARDVVQQAVLRPAEEVLHHHLTLRIIHNHVELMPFFSDAWADEHITVHSSVFGSSCKIGYKIGNMNSNGLVEEKSGKLASKWDYLN
jgi:hypothetical protein